MNTKEPCAVCTFPGCNDRPLIKLEAVHMQKQTVRDYFAHKQCIGTLLVIHAQETFQAVINLSNGAKK